MATTPVNAAPMFIPLGTDDKSTRPITPAPIPIPSHLPLVFLKTARGPVVDEMGLAVRELVDGSKLLKLYGDRTLDVNDVFYNHATKLANTVLGKGNSILVQRLVSEDARNVKANITVYLDVLPTKVPNYKRHRDGSIAYDENGEPIEDENSPIDGFKVKLVGISERSTDDVNPATSPIGTKTTLPGTMVDDSGESTVRSQMYPILEFQAMYPGSDYNNIGFAINLISNDMINPDVIELIKALPFELYVYEKKDGVPTIKRTLFGSQYKDFVFKPNTTDPITNKPYTLPEVLYREWYNTDNMELPLEYPDVQKPYIYYDNLEFLLAEFIQTEKPYINADIETVDGVIVNTSEWFDFLPDATDNENKWLLNPFNAFSSKRVKYFSIVYDDSAVDDKIYKNVYFNANLPFYLANGIDGDLTEEKFEELVSVEMDKYIDPNSEFMDLAKNVESVFYDSGFSIDVKKKLANFIGLRKDTFLVLSTREDKLGDKFVDLSTERAIAINLKARLQLFPESTFFGTPVARAMIVAGNGIDKNDNTNHRWPLTLHVAAKAARMMGAGNGKWNPNYLFFKGEDNVIEQFIDVQPAFVPQGVKPALWSAGLVWPEKYDFRRYYFPAMQTVYDDDTSILNNFAVGMAITKITKVAAAAHRKFSGVVEYTPDRLIEEVENYMMSELKDRFAGVVKPVVKVMITDYDKERGYSWTTVVKMYANNMRTVNTFSIEAWRLEDYTG